MSALVATYITMAAALLLAIVFPVGIFASRNNVRSRRQEIITALEGFFRIDEASKPRHKKWEILPSFEFVKSKYFDRDGKARQPSLEEAFSFPVFIFIALSFFCFYTSLIITTHNCFFGSESVISLEQRDSCLFSEGAPKSIPIFIIGGVNTSATELQILNVYLQTLTVICFAFLGAYISSIKTLLRAVSNFDLSPLTFFRCNFYMISSVIIAVVVWKSGTVIGDVLSASGNLLSNGDPSIRAWQGGFQAWILVAFVLGFVPALGERTVTRLWRRGTIKMVDDRATDDTKITPLEAIQGVDPDIRARLEDHNLYDVQNLATANPIILFVETPYGIYQSIDWVGQAQLLTLVGFQNFQKLQKIGIRTIFDFVGAFFPACQSFPAPYPSFTSTNPIQNLIAEILMNTASAKSIKMSEADFVPAAYALAQLAAQDLAFRRLLQIWETIGDKLPPDPQL